MRRSDVSSYASRSDAVFDTIAYDLIGSRIDNQQTTGIFINLAVLILVVGTDVVTLIEMRDTSVVVFEREPVTNVLYNTLLERRNAFPHSHGNYVDALSVAKRILLPGMYAHLNPIKKQTGVIITARFSYFSSPMEDRLTIYQTKTK